METQIDCDLNYAPQREVGDLLGSPIFESPLRRNAQLKNAFTPNSPLSPISDFDPIPCNHSSPVCKKAKRSIEVSISPCLTNISQKNPVRSNSLDAIKHVVNNSMYTDDSNSSINSLSIEGNTSTSQSGRFKISISHGCVQSDFVKISPACSRFSVDVQVTPPSIHEDDFISTISHQPNNCMQCDDLITF